MSRMHGASGIGVAGSLVLSALVLPSLVLPSLAAAQDAPEDAFEDPYRDETARSLHNAAMDERVRFDDTVLKYTAVVRQRIGASLRMPLKDRTLYRSEGAHRLWWDRDGEDLIQLLAFREQTPGGVNAEALELDRFDTAFDPMDDRLLFGLGDDEDDIGEPGEDDFWFEHPLYPEYADRYWFSSGDTLTLSLPDGRRILAIELQVVPREADVHRMTGALWIEPESGSLVRAVYRLSDQFDAFRDIQELRDEEDDDLNMIPGIFKPWTADITMIAVDYSLWEFEVWMPRSMRVDVLVAAGILKSPVSVEYSYEIEAVTTEKSLAEGDEDDLPVVHFRTRSEAMAYLNHLAFGEDVEYEVQRARGGSDSRARYMVPLDRAFLGESPHLPPPIWEDAPGFTSEAELGEMFEAMADLPLAPVRQVPTTLRWGLQRPDLLRFNRVEGLSVGARWQARPNSFIGPISVSALGRIGYGDLQPVVEIGFTRESLRRRIALSGFNELAAIDERARHLGLGNSVLAAFVGRDDGDYYYRSGAALEWMPPTAARQTFKFRGYAEYHRPAEVNTQFALFKFWKDGWAYRPNIDAQEGWEYGAVLDVTPWWGTDPLLTQGGLDLMVQGGTGMTDYARASLIGRVVFPLPARLRFAVEAGGGYSWGTPTVQRQWSIGGPRTLRGYEPRLSTGEDHLRGRAEVALTASFGSVFLFSDYGWAGSLGAFELDNGFYSVGAGTSLLDGLFRIDAGYGLKDPRGFRLDFYLDAIL
jgi:hypothetical protein